MATQDLDLRQAPRPAKPAADPVLTAAVRPPRESLLARLAPRSFLGRSLLIIFVPVVLLQVISTWAFYERHYDTITRRLSQAVAGEILGLVDVLDNQFDPGTIERVIELAGRAFSLQVSLDEATELPPQKTYIWPSILEEKLTQALRERLNYPYIIDTRSLPDQVLIQVDLGETLMTVLVPRERLFSSTSYIFISWMIGSSIVLFLIATVFMRNQVRPIGRLAHAADCFGRGLDVADFRPEGATEVRQAAAAFIKMRERLKRQIQQRTTMLAGVSHDLRTPLTRMKLELAMLHSPEAESLRLDVAQMEKMIEGYLAFARGEGTEQPKKVDLSELIRQTVNEARREGAEVDLHIEQQMTATLRPEAMRRCLANLIGNAHRYGGQVSVQAGRRKRGFEILIDDTGEGIPQEVREDVFKPFIRLEESRNPTTGGTGLGLTIARDVVRGHGGDLTLGDAPGGGLRARIWIPR